MSLSPGRFSGRTAVVTGAAQGIGKAVALRLAAEGAQVVIGDLAADHAEAVASEVRETGAEAQVISCDLSTWEGAEALLAGTVERFGKVDVLVNNVGGALKVAPYHRFTPAEVEREITRSLWPTLWCCYAALPHMLERASGSIVNVGSTSPRGIYRAPYAAAKGGVFALTTALSLEVAAQGVRINCVAPGATAVADRVTPRDVLAASPGGENWGEELKAFFDRTIPMGRWGTVDEQAAAIAFLASDEASFITGQVLTVGGGLTVP
jgi:dihydroxycyclohexadiene carboxylate dehydrogenase